MSIRSKRNSFSFFAVFAADLSGFAGSHGDKSINKLNDLNCDPCIHVTRSWMPRLTPCTLLNCLWSIWNHVRIKNKNSNGLLITWSLILARNTYLPITNAFEIIFSNCRFQKFGYFLKHKLQIIWYWFRGLLISNLHTTLLSYLPYYEDFQVWS